VNHLRTIGAILSDRVLIEQTAESQIAARDELADLESLTIGEQIPGDGSRVGEIANLRVENTLTFACNFWPTWGHAALG